MLDPSEQVTPVDRASGSNGSVAAGTFYQAISVISLDGRAVLFNSAGLSPLPGAIGDNVFVHNLRTLTTTLVSGLTVTSDPWPDTVWPNNSSSPGSVSANDRRVAFASSASDLTRTIPIRSATSTHARFRGGVEPWLPEPPAVDAVSAVLGPGSIPGPTASGSSPPRFLPGRVRRGLQGRRS